MVKLMLKEPVGGMISQDGIPARSQNYLEAEGHVTEELQRSFDEALEKNTSLSFVAPNTQPFLIAARNIAYILETQDAKDRTVS